MPGLPATGELTYNGYTFDGASHIKCKVVPIYDDAGRTVKALTHTISVIAIITDDESTDSDIENIRTRLLEGGGKLTFINKGFGDDLKVDPNGELSDIRNGPSPKLLAWEPIGDVRAVEIEWQIETTLPCLAQGSKYRKFGIMDIMWGAEYQIDKHGNTKRTLSGYMEIVQKSGPQSGDSADRYRNFFAPVPVVGFTREQDWKLTPDRTRLEFTIVDTELPSPNPYFEGMTAMSGSHRLTMTNNKGRRERMNTITMSITPAAKLSGAQAWLAFAKIVQDRRKYAERQGMKIMVRALEIEEGLFDRTQSFTYRYQFLNSLPNIIGQSGLWQPLGTNWDKWTTSLLTDQFNRRGHSTLFDIPQNDVVVNLCTDAYPIVPNFKRDAFPKLFPKPSGPNKPEKADQPSADKSYSMFRHQVSPTATSTTVQQQVLQAPREDNGFWPVQVDDNIRTAPGTSISMGTSSEERVPDIIQQGTDRKFGVRYAGIAERVGYPHPRPKAETLGDQALVEVNGYYNWEIVSNFGGVPVYMSRWVLDYVLGKSPGTIKPPAKLGD